MVLGACSEDGMTAWGSSSAQALQGAQKGPCVTTHTPASLGSSRKNPACALLPRSQRQSAVTGLGIALGHGAHAQHV